MALIIDPYGGGQIVGRLGAVVFQRGPFGTVARQGVIPVNPQSPRQVAQRAGMDDAANRWKLELVGAQRTAWEDYAKLTPITSKLGTTHIISGRAMYLRQAAVRSRGGFAAIDSPPPVPGQAPINKADPSSDTVVGIVIEAPPIPLVPGAILQVLLSAPNNQTRNYFKGPYVETFFMDDSFLFPFTIRLPGQVAIGQRYFIQERYYDEEGAVSPSVTAQTDVLT